MANLMIIKDLAERKGISIKNLAKQINVRPQAIHVMARNGTTRIDTLEKVAHALGVPMSIFFDENYRLQSDFQNTGHHNAIATSGTANFYDGSVTKELIKTKDALLKAKDDLLRAKDELIKVKDELLSTKDEVRNLREKLARYEKTVI